MVLNSLDIQNKDFSTQMRGYNKKEVEDFFDIIVRDYDYYAQKVKELERENKNLAEKVEYFEEMKDSLNKSLIIAQDTSDNVRAQADTEAENILTDARQKANAIITASKSEGQIILDTARDDAVRLVRETDELKRNLRSYHQRIQMTVQAQLDSINDAEWDEIFRPVSTYIPNQDEVLRRIVEETFEGEQYTSRVPLAEIADAIDQASKEEE
ncbi:DivIVA domain-containing protein [Streptococcaceae bacterium ESL0729]|nr:DivIVA domain-containing protein [Streptococcaceae bacterium ESL0729]